MRAVIQSCLQQPLLELAFRPFFLLAAALSVMALLAWAAVLNGITGWQPALLSPLLWHIHEMLFGFALTVACAFLLTAVQTWTGQRSMHGAMLLVLIIVWLVIRFLVWQPWWGFSPLLFTLVMTLQLSWWALMIGFFGWLLWRSGSRRNYQFIVMLLMIAALHLVFLALAQGDYLNQALHLSHSVLMFFSVMISVIAGRVIPMFTRNGCRMAGISARVEETPAINRALMLLLPPTAVCFLCSYWWPLNTLTAVLLFVVGGLHLLRNMYWAPLATLTQPLLWSLQLSYFCLGLSFVMLGVSLISDVLPFSSALHLLTLGTLGGMILAMISRVSLGHTGRPLQVSNWIRAAFLLIFCAAAFRLILPLAGYALSGWNLAVVCWCLAFSLFLYRYFPVLSRA
ncbi:NnrS family protein [Bacterioplanoides pacificum]|uniref:NnrS family protein n=1 Tax=Bacterioplanoides pacificum TaxID=1171596 RepID=A0ABV7VRC2_9GAMM